MQLQMATFNENKCFTWILTCPVCLEFVLFSLVLAWQLPPITKCKVKHSHKNFCLIFGLTFANITVFFVFLQHIFYLFLWRKAIYANLQCPLGTITIPFPFCAEKLTQIAHNDIFLLLFKYFLPLLYIPLVLDRNSQYTFAEITNNSHSDSFFMLTVA